MTVHGNGSKLCNTTLHTFFSIFYPCDTNLLYYVDAAIVLLYYQFLSLLWNFALKFVMNIVHCFHIILYISFENLWDLFLYFHCAVNRWTIVSISVKAVPRKEKNLHSIWIFIEWQIYIKFLLHAYCTDFECTIKFYFFYS